MGIRERDGSGRIRNERARASTMLWGCFSNDHALALNVRPTVGIGAGVTDGASTFSCIDDSGGTAVSDRSGAIVGVDGAASSPS